eukprot:12301133-Heterocapsa_arctica.AAC.1
MEEQSGKEGSGIRAPAGTQKNQKVAKTQEEQLTPSQVEARRRAQDKEGVSQIFMKRPQETQGSGSGGDQRPSEDESTHTNGQTHLEPEADPGGPMESVNQKFGQASSSSYRTGSYPLEIAIQAEQVREDRIRDSWDQESRITDLANRKQRWHAEKYRQTDSHREGSTRFSRNHATGSDPQGSRKGSAKHSALTLGSNEFSTRGPKAAGGPGPPEPPSASEGVDREEAGAPLGQLVQGAGREAGPLEPLAAPM